jgi:hypothetical protein
MLERALANDSSSTAAIVRALFDHMGAGIEGFYGFFRGIFREIVKIQVGLEEGGAADVMRRRSFERLTALLARGQERGELTRELDAADLARSFDALSNGTINHWLYDGTTGSLREWMNHAAQVFLGPVALAPARDEPVPDLTPLMIGAPSEVERVLARRSRAAPRRNRR